MKSTLLLFAGLALYTSAALAQTAPPAPAPGQAPATQLPTHRVKRPKTPQQSADHHAAKLGQSLGLSASQQTRAHAVFLAESQEAQAIKAKYPAATQHKAMHQEIKTMHAKYQSQLKGVLTADQYTHYITMQQEKKAHHGKKGK